MKLKILVMMLATSFAGGALAQSIEPGNVLCVDQTAGTNQLGTLFIVDQTSGSRTVFSDFGNVSQGALGVDPDAVAWMPPLLLGLIPGEALVTDGSAGTNQQGALFLVDPTTGNRTLFSDFGNSAQGPLGEYPVSVLVVPANLLSGFSGVLVDDAYAGTNGQGAIFSVDSAGNRTTVIDFGDSTGPQGQYPDSMALYQGLLGLGNAVLVADGSAGTNSLGALFSINPATSTRSILSDFGNSAQGYVDPNPLSTPVAVLVTPTDQIYVLAEESGTNGAGVLIEVNPTTGYRTLVSDFGNAAEGAQAIGVSPNSLTWLPNQGLIGVADADAGPEGDGAIFTVNPSNGQRATFSDFGNVGQGPLGAEPSGVAVAQ